MKARILVVALLALLFRLVPVNDGVVVAAEKSALRWEVSGLWSDACPCDPICPCWFNKKATLDHCDNVQVFKIEKGHYDNVRLDGVVVVAAWATPEGETMVSGAQKSKVLAFYVDESTTQPQRGAIEKIWCDHIFSSIKAGRGELKAVRLVADIKPDYAKVSIPKILSYEVKEWKDKRAKLVSAVHGAPHLSDLRQGSSLSYSYSDYGLSWSYPGKNALFATFKANPSIQAVP